MLVLVILCFLLVEFKLALISKFDLIEKFKIKASKLNSRFLYKLSNCMFCIHFHLSVIATLVFACFINFDSIYILTPFLVSGLKQITNGN